MYFLSNMVVFQLTMLVFRAVFFAWQSWVHGFFTAEFLEVKDDGSDDGSLFGL